MIKRIADRWKDGPLAAAILLSAGCVLAFAPDAYILMMARSFLWPWTFAFLVLALTALFTHRWWSAGAAVLAAMLAGTPPRSIEQPPMHGGRMALRVAQMNLLQPNDRHAEVIASALATDADVISFQEVSPAWATVLVNTLGARYPHRVLWPATNCYGIALFSRFPLDRAEVRDLHGSPMIAATVAAPSGAVDVLAVHTTSPGDLGDFMRRNRQLDALPDHLSACTHPVVLIGDLNAVCWDQALVRMCMRSGSREHPDNRRPSWPSFAGISLAPIDHILATPGLFIADIEHFRIPGSDHRGLVARIHRRS